MTSVHCAENHGLKVSRQLFASAIHAAAGVISRWTNELITLTVNEIREVPLEEACAELDVGDELRQGVDLPFAISSPGRRARLARSLLPH